MTAKDTAKGKPEPATAKGSVKPGLYTSELALVVGVPAIDGLVSFLLTDASIPPHWRLAAYSLVAIYTLSRAWVKGRAS